MEFKLGELVKVNTVAQPKVGVYVGTDDGFGVVRFTDVSHVLKFRLSHLTTAEKF